MKEGTNKCLFVAAYLSIFDEDGINALGFTKWKEALAYIGNSLGNYKASYIKNLRDEFDAITGNQRIGWVNRPPRKIIVEIYDQVKKIKFKVYTEDVKLLISGKELNVYEEDKVDIENVSTMLKEGKMHSFLSKRYERNPKARKICLDYYGYKCQICEFESKNVYGEIFKNKIHVHHIIPVADIKKDYIVDPIKDLIPVCPNCHMILHCKKDGYYTPEQVKLMLKENRAD